MTSIPIQLSKTALRDGKYDRQAFMSVPRNPVYIVLDSITCQHNVGCILRMADAVLAQRVFLCGATPMLPSKKLRKGSRGAEKWVAWEYQAKVQDVLCSLKSDGVAIVALELCDQSIAYTEADYSMPVCFVLGAEGKGVSPGALAQADLVVHLPMLGMMNSLNVSTAASVLLYHYLDNHKAQLHE